MKARFLERRRVVLAALSAFALALLPGAQSPSKDAATKSATRVLFVGNSYTYVNDLPALVRALGRAAKPKRELEVECIASGGCTLEKHAAAEGANSPRERIAKGQFDFVVLQEQSTRPFDDPDAMLAAAKKLGAAITESKATPIWFATWARKAAPEKQEAISAAYRRCADAVGGRIAPVGPAWQHALAAKKPPELYDDDGSHPSPAGSYLAALVIYGEITNSALDDLPAKLVEQDGSGAERVLVDLDASQAKALRKVAAQALAAK